MSIKPAYVMYFKKIISTKTIQYCFSKIHNNCCFHGHEIIIENFTPIKLLIICNIIGLLNKDYFLFLIFGFIGKTLFSCTKIWFIQVEYGLCKYDKSSNQWVYGNSRILSVTTRPKSASYHCIRFYTNEEKYNHGI